jgi:hypothetical protein
MSSSLRRDASAITTSPSAASLEPEERVIQQVKANLGSARPAPLHVFCGANYRVA